MSKETQKGCLHHNCILKLKKATSDSSPQKNMERFPSRLAKPWSS